MWYWHGAGAVPPPTMIYMMDIIKYKWWGQHKQGQGSKKTASPSGIWPNEIFLKTWIAMLAEMEAPPAGKLSKTSVGYNMSSDFCQTSGAGLIQAMEQSGPVSLFACIGRWNPTQLYWDYNKKPTHGAQWTTQDSMECHWECGCINDSCDNHDITNYFCFVES